MNTEDKDAFVFEHAYSNRTSCPVEITGYSHSYSQDAGSENLIPKVFDEKWRIESYDVVIFREVHGASGQSVLIPKFCDSVEIVFDARKKLFYRRIPKDGNDVAPENTGTIYDPDRYVRTEMDSRRTHFLYEITEADYESAVDITDASSDENLDGLMQ